MEVLEEGEVSVPEVTDLLAGLDESELKHFQKLTLEYCRLFSSFTPESARKVINVLVNEFKLAKNVAVQVVNCCPKSRVELMAILHKTDLIGQEDKLDAILKLLGDNATQ